MRNAPKKGSTKARYDDDDYEKPVYTCPYCKKTFTDYSSWGIHKQLHTSTNIFECELCTYTCRIKKYLTRHMKFHQPPTDYKCEVCGKGFRFRDKLRSHMRVHTGEKPFKCSVCGKAFSANYSLSTHMYTHTDEKPFKCTFCEYACRDSSTLRKHEERHIGLHKIYQCRICNKTYDCKSKLTSHQEEKHFGIDNKKIPCEQCNKFFKTRQNLEKHVQAIHEKSLQCECEVCGHVLSNKANLTAHMKRHVDVRPYKCTFAKCGKQFKDKSDLKRHTIIHYPDKQFPCEICGKLFARKRRLDLHLNVHAPKKKSVECEHCGVLFYSKRYLTKHVKMKHTKKKQKYICDLCDFKTHNKPSIVMHLKYGHSGWRDKKCQLCNKDFKKHEYLKLHYLRIHNLRFKMGTIKPEVKPPVVIKEEPLDEEYKEELQPEIDLLEIHKEELKEVKTPEPEFSDSVKDYSNAVFSEDVSHSILEGGSRVTSEPEKEFDGVFIDHDMEKPDVNIIEDPPPDPELETITTYSKKVLSEDISRCLLERDGRQDEGPETEINRIFIDHVTEKPEKLGVVIAKKNISAYKEKYVKKKVKEMLLEISNKKEAAILEEARKQYNTRIEMALRRANKKEHVNIKYFQNKKSEDTTNDITEGDDIAEHNEPVTDDVDNDGDDQTVKNNKIKFNTHQCYICFKLFPTKSNLTEHCKHHFDICNYKMLKKCPYCGYVTNLNIRQHLKIKHDVTLQFPYNKITERNNESGSKYIYEIDKDTALEIIPSIKNLNRLASIKIDERKRHDVNNKIAKTKLIRKGNQWIVDKELIKLSTENILPEFSLDEYAKIKIKGDKYENVLRKLGFLAKKRGLVMLFPCDGCEKICQTLSGLVLHKRKHEINPKAFKPKVWKNRIVKAKNVTKTENLMFNKEDFKNLKVIWNLKLARNLNKGKGLRYDKNVKTADNNQNARNMDSVASNSRNDATNNNVGSNNNTKTTTNIAIKRNRVPNGRNKIENRFAKPKPIVNKHKCDKELMEFYENNIKGADIEFWQFLKIFNKMSRENVNDFKDLEHRSDFGLHFDGSTESSLNDNIESENNLPKEVIKENIAASTTETSRLQFENRIGRLSNKECGNTRILKKVSKINTYRRVLMISKKDRQRRNDIKNQLRRRIEESKITDKN